MKRLFCLFAMLAAIMGVSGGNAEGTSPSSGILIAYFTWAENTVVEDEAASLQSALNHYSRMGDSASGADAVSSASLLSPGNTAVMAGYIHDAVGGDLFSILVEEPYPSNYEECLERAADELDDEARPVLKSHVEHMEQYNTVFLGIPNWWYSCPMAVKCFVEAYDFSGKTVIPFVSHGTGGISGSVRDMCACLPKDCIVLDPIGVYRPNVASCRPEIEKWLQELGFMTVTAAGYVDENVPQDKLRIRLTVDEQTLYAVLEDNSASRSLLNQMPMTLTFEDYNSTEKIAYPAHELDTSDAPDNCDPDVGTLAYYKPWGNLCIFYRDFRASSGLVPLGRIEGDMTILSHMNGSFSVLMEQEYDER